MTKDNGMKLLAEIENTRAQIESISSEIEWLRTSRLSPSEAKSKLSEIVQRKALGFDGGDVLPGHLTHPTASPNALSIKVSQVLHAPPGGGVVNAELDLAPALCWLFGDAMLKRIGEQIDSLDYVPGPPMAERPAAIESLINERHRFETLEEDLICKVEGLGIPVARREDADPAVVLGYDPDGTMAELRLIPRVTVPPR